MNVKTEVSTFFQSLMENTSLQEMNIRIGPHGSLQHMQNEKYLISVCAWKHLKLFDWWADTNVHLL